MKFRWGFVSNSSSSNFILAFNKKPRSVKELQKLLFGDKKFLTGYDEYAAGTDLIAEAVFAQLKKPLELDEILLEISEMEGVYIDDFKNKNVPEFDDPKYDEYAKAKEEKEIVRALKWFTDWKCPDDQVFFLVTFGDENGQFESLCEHGGIFDNIHHAHISHH